MNSFHIQARTTSLEMVGENMYTAPTGATQPVSKRILAGVHSDESVRQIEQLIAVCSDMIYVYDVVERRNVYVNHEIHALLDYTPEQFQHMVTTLAPAILHPDDQPSIALHIARMSVARDDETLVIEYRLRHADTSYRWLRSHEVVFARDEDGSVRQILGMARDVTQQRLPSQPEERAEQPRAEVAHDLSALLQRLLDYADMALQDLQPTNASHHYLTMLRAEAQQLAELARQQFSDAPKIEASH